MADLRKQQLRNGYAMIASGIALFVMGEVGDVPGPWDDAALLTSFAACVGTAINSVRLNVAQYRQRKQTKGR